MKPSSQSVPDKVSYRDSRRAAARILSPGKKHALRRLVSFVLVSALVWYVWNTLTGSLPPEQRAVLFLFLMAVGLWVTEAVPGQEVVRPGNAPGRPGATNRLRKQCWSRFHWRHR